MDFLDEETRPRFLFQSRPLPHPSTSTTTTPRSTSLHKPTLLVSLSLSLLFFTLSLLSLQSEPINSLLFWIAFSLLLGPFAPSSLTAGNIRVGLGPTLPNPEPEQQLINPLESNKKTQNRKSKTHQKPREVSDSEINYTSTPVSVNGSVRDSEKKEENFVVVEEIEWSEGDLELLKKLLVKNPVGKPGRWEAISEGFKGRHGVESVIKKAKEMGEKRMGDEDSFARFLKDRKPMDQRSGGGVVESGEVKRENEGGGGGTSWSGGDDIALLNALKAFPKEVLMRWEKIAAAVPGKSKAACVKRMAELKREFRSSKATSAEV